MEGNPSKSTSSPTDQRFEEYLDQVIDVTYDGFQITRKQTLIGYEFTLVRDAFYAGMGAGIAHQSVWHINGLHATQATRWYVCTTQGKITSPVTD